MSMRNSDQLYQIGDWQLGFLPGDTGGGLSLPGFDPISAVVGGVFDVINSLISGARQRGTDEAKSGVALQSSVDSIYYLKELVQSGRSTKTEARDAFYLKILPAFLQFISTLQTKSVVESRTTNQRQDLINLFEKEVMSLPDVPKNSPPIIADAGDVFPDISDEDFGYTEYYNPSDGSYYYEDDNGWYYEDVSGNYQYGDSDGNLYAGTVDGEYWEIGTDGTSYWEGSDGSFYQEYSDGSWTSGDVNGFQCDGDGAGNWVCEDGTGGRDWRESPVAVIRQTGQTRRQGQIAQQLTFDKYLKQAIALIPKQQRTATNQQRATTAIGSRQATSAQERLIGASPKSSGLILGGGGSNLLLIGGIALGLFLILRNR